MKYLTRHKNQVCDKDNLELEKKYMWAGVVGKVYGEGSLYQPVMLLPAITESLIDSGFHSEDL